MTTIKTVVRLYRGCVEASIGTWRMVGRDVVRVADGRAVAAAAPVNVADAGFDVQLVTESWDDAGDRAMKALFGSKHAKRGDHTAAIAKWLERHPEALAPSRPLPAEEQCLSWRQHRIRERLLENKSKRRRA